MVLQVEVFCSVGELQVKNRFSCGSGSDLGAVPMQKVNIDVWMWGGRGLYDEMTASSDDS